MAKHKLLLADDSITIQKVVNLTFADEGIEVISVGDGNAAIEKLAEFTPDLVMADINMPGLSGYEICERLRANEATRRIPVILLVGSFEPFDEAEAQRVGANDFLTKPFQSIRQLVTKVSGLLEATAERTSTDEVISDLDSAETQRMPGEFENTLEIETPVMTEEFGDSGMDDEMIQTSQISPNEVQYPEIESVADDDRITQPLTTAEFDAIHQTPIEEERGYAFVGEIPFSASPESEDAPQEISTLAETEPLPQNDSYYQTQRVVNEPIFETEDDGNLLELPPQRESFSTAAISTPIWQEEVAPVAKTNEIVPEPDFDAEKTLSNEEVQEENQYAPSFETAPAEKFVNEPYQEIQTESYYADEEIQTETETVIEPVAESFAEYTTESAETNEFDIRQAPTDEMIDVSEIGLPKTETVEQSAEVSDADSQVAETPAVAAQGLNLSPEVIDAIAAKVSERFSDKVLRELVEELKPQITEMIAKRIAE